MLSSTAARGPDDSLSVDQEVLSRIQHLDVTKDITGRSRSAVAYGGFSEVFRGLLSRDGHRHVDVAIKRLRFHVDEAKVNKASLFELCFLVRTDSQRLSSNSPRKCTYGQSYLTQTSCHSWVLLSARKHASPYSFPNGCTLVLPGHTCKILRSRISYTWLSWFVPSTILLQGFLAD